jgi:hypothetical protein
LDQRKRPHLRGRFRINRELRSVIALTTRKSNASETQRQQAKRSRLRHGCRHGVIDAERITGVGASGVPLMIRYALTAAYPCEANPRLNPTAEAIIARLPETQRNSS